MNKLLALDVDGPWEGDWHRVRGNERGIVVHSGAGDARIWLEVEEEDGRIVTRALSVGMTEMELNGARRYRLVRDSHEAEFPPMTVELVTNGSSSS